ncbi:MAG TPA: hypothetical protein EYP19_07355 [Desulfobacterales bacterium]|nr:hypothetical protein [Desulfobacterales bacterium]
MNLEEIRNILSAEWAWKTNGPACGNWEVSSCRASDLMSDVLSFHGVGSLLLTGLTNAQVVRTAGVADIVAICFVRGKWPGPETVRLAEEQGIPLLVTHLMMFEACGKLYAKGLRGEAA